MKRKRNQEINLDSILEIGKKALRRFRYGTDHGPKMRVIGIAIVGSTLTNDFVEKESDFDFYFITPHELGCEDTFWQYINEHYRNNGSSTNSDINTHIPDVFSGADCYGTVSKDEIAKKLRDPYEIYMDPERDNYKETMAKADYPT